MNKLFYPALMLLVCFLGTVSVQAQDESSSRGNRVSLAELIERQGERMAEELKLEGENKDAFLQVFRRYRADMFAQRDTTLMAREPRKEGTRKETSELTEIEAVQRMQELFDRRAAQLVQSQREFQLQKQYYVEFAKVLTPQQLFAFYSTQLRDNSMFTMPTNRQGERQGRSMNGRPGRRFGGGAPGGFGAPDGFGGMD